MHILGLRLRVAVVAFSSWQRTLWWNVLAGQALDDFVKENTTRQLAPGGKNKKKKLWKCSLCGRVTNTKEKMKDHFIERHEQAFADWLEVWTVGGAVGSPCPCRCVVWVSARVAHSGDAGDWAFVCALHSQPQSPCSTWRKG